MPDAGKAEQQVVTLGVTGGIAAYKTADIVRLLRKMDVAVQVVMTENATRLMSPHTLATLSEHPVATEMFAPDQILEPGIRHIRLSRSADLIIVAPATANILGKVACGIADDLLSTSLLASSAPVLFAPAMNELMWRHAAVQTNISKLRDWGYHFVGPGTGELACGETGVGRMSEPWEIVDAAVRFLLEKGRGLRILVTAGPTEEPVDPVRVLSNRSSGKMGIAIAEAARNRGHAVTLISGPVTAQLPFGVKRIQVQTAEEMLGAVTQQEAEADVLVMTAAVADYRPRRAETCKMPSGQQEMTLALEPNPDILASVGPGRSRRGDITIGFALEIGDSGEERAWSKLEEKGLDLIVLNDATQPDSAFGGDTTRQVFIFRDKTVERLPVQRKSAAAVALVRAFESLHANSIAK
jgi:phosphopantothenoylcysteine decarboxylase / phosphopantothenate---cysteine ligase